MFWDCVIYVANSGYRSFYGWSSYTAGFPTAFSGLSSVYAQNALRIYITCASATSTVF